MAVYTEVTFDQAAALMAHVQCGVLTDLRGIQGGIENTNYFATCERDGHTHEHVLTVFERLSFEQLPFYLHLMRHLAEQGIPVPKPAADAHGEILHRLCNKPAAVVNRLTGRSELAPSPEHCRAVGEMLARMHLAGRGFERSQPNLRGLAWWNETVPVVLPFLSPEQSQLISAELAYQNHVASGSLYAALPQGPIHADLFRDNVMFDGHTLTGFFDFYFAGCDTWLFDIAVCLNDWCIEHRSDALDGQARMDCTQAFVQAYQSVRPLSAAERQLMPAMLRAGALRFWLSRLWDFHLPREASMLQAHDPAHFERVLRQRIAHAHQMAASTLSTAPTTPT
ncbi:MAG: homoserine kinase [Pseudomonadota bacterium]|jgi:homoserine kinase type II